MEEVTAGSSYQRDLSLLKRSERFTSTRNHADVQHTMKAPLSDQLSAFRALYRLDEVSERMASKYSNHSGIVFLAGAGGAFAGLQVHPGLALGVAVVGLIGFAVLRSKVSAARATDMDDRKLDAAFRPLVVLGPDLKRGVPFEVFTNFFAYDNAHAPDAAGRFDQQWLRLQLPMIDGSVVLASVRLRSKRKVKYKRKGTKRTEKLSEQLAVTVKLGGGRAIPPGAVDSLRPSASRSDPGGMRVRSLKGEGRRLTMVFETPVATHHNGFPQNFDKLVDGQKIVDAIVRAHRVAMAASGGAAAG